MTQPAAAVDDYMKALPDKRHQEVSKLRTLILDTLPDAQETIAYNMPAVKVVDEEILCSYKAQKNYISLYMDVEVVAQHQEALAHLNCGKSCIRFRRYDQLPEDTIRTMLRQTAEKQMALTTTPP